METHSLNCPNCGAPLTLLDKQSIAICVFCNSSVQIAMSQNSPPVLTKIPEISSEVIDEVKRLMIMGSSIKAVDYYMKNSSVSQLEANTAINALKKTIGYNPPLNQAGIIKFFMLELISALLIAGGIWLILNKNTSFGILASILGVLFAFINWFAYRSSFNAYRLLKNGIEANAKILKRWDIKVNPATANSPERNLIRLLLEVTPENKMTYITEANCVLGEKSNLKCQPDFILKVKYSKDDQKKVVVSAID
jgi:hypothetical protein